MAQRKGLSWGLLLLVIGSWGVGPRSAAAEKAATPAAFSFRVPAPSVLTTADADGYDIVRVDGFGALPQRPGVPSIPTDSVRIAIPDGVRPRLDYRVLGERFIAGVHPRPVPLREARPGPEAARELRRDDLPESERVDLLMGSIREVPRPDARIYGGESTWPSDPVRLGEIGIFRDQRFVEVELAPVRWDPVRGGLVVAQGIEVTISFDGATTRRGPRTSGTKRFEDVYRGMFLNYEQGLDFRIAPAGVPESGASIPRSPSGTTAPRYWIEVDQDGPVRLDYQALLPTGLLDFDPRTWRLTQRGQPVALRIADDGDPLLEPGEYVEFWGQAWTIEPKTEVDVEYGGPLDDIWALLDTTDVNVYLLTADLATQAEMPERDATPTFGGTPPGSFVSVAHAEVDDGWRPVAGEDPWLWLPTLSAASATASRTETIPLPGLADATGPLSIRVVLRGLTQTIGLDPDHETVVTVKNGANQVLAQSQQTFDGRGTDEHVLAWSDTGGALAGDPLKVEIASLLVGTQERNDVTPDFIEIGYPRQFTATGGRLVFDWPDGPGTDFVVDGLADTAAQIYEITPTTGELTLAPVHLTGAAAVAADAIRFHVDNDPVVPDGTPRRFAVVENASAVVPSGAAFVADVVSDLRQTTNQADLIVIAHPDVVDLSPSGSLQQLLDYRATPAGGGLTSKVVLLDDVEDDFNDGFRGPQAIREFLRWVMSTATGEGWAEPKPSYVLLIGDATFETKNGTAAGEYVPTQILFQDEPELSYYASDNSMAAVVGADRLPDVVISRMPARSVSQSNTMLQKVLAYETTAPAGDWQSHALFIADRGKKDAGGVIDFGESIDFEETNHQALVRMSLPPFGADELKYYTSYCSDVTNTCDAVGMNADIDDVINGVAPATDGAAVTQYVGHGNFFVWSDDAFFDERFNPLDTEQLFNGGRLPWLLAHNCLTGGFHVPPGNTMAEDWVKRVGGGAVGAWSPSGLSRNDIGRPISNSVWSGMFDNRKIRDVGTLVLEALAIPCTSGPIEACQNYILLGDPALQLRLRSVDPATSLDASAGDHEVTLTWQPSDTAGTISYQVYRASSLTPPFYSSVGTTTSTTLVDSSAQNAFTYYYYVVARDVDGFESRWSNFNSDCGAGTPTDCASATPLNPNPPDVPSGLEVSDPATGNALLLRWAPAIETDIAHYTIVVGNASGDYTQSIETGKVPSILLTGLTEGATYYMAVKASNTSGLSSGLSLEISGTPSRDRGLRAPAFIDDLALSRQGDDILIEWSEVVDDLYGAPKDPADPVTSYEILRGTGTAFDNAALSPIGTCNAPCASFLDPGAAVAVASYHYRVRAIDADGNLGGLGSEPPRPVDLAVSWSALTPGDLHLEWAPVTLATDDSATGAVSYRIYAGSAPIGRAAIRDGLVSPLTTASTTDIELTPASGDRYYSVVAVDARGNVSPD